MRTITLVGLLSISSVSYGQVWFENFSGEANGSTSGTAVGGTWSTTLPAGGAGSFSRFDFGAPYGAVFRVNDTGTEGVWRSNVENISALGEVALEITLGGNATTSADYVRAYYRIDGGAEVLFAEVIGDAGLNVFTATSAIVSGNTLEIVVRGSDNSPGGFANTMGFDNVTVTDISVLYSRTNGNWGTPSTWSETGFAGVPCGCTPDGDSRVIIGGGRTVTLNSNGSAAGVEIQNTGVLSWSGNNRVLTVERGGAVNVFNGGTLTHNGTSGSAISFGAYSYSITNHGLFEVGVLDFNSSANSTVVNNGTMSLSSATGLDINATNGYVITNTGTLNLISMSLNNGNLTFDNSGTINQTGDFNGIDGGSAFNNLSGGVWSFGGTTIANVRLFADNGTNTFNYNRGGNQTIISPQDSYSNLTLSTGGTKTAAGNFSVKGNWTRSATATFAPAGYRVSLTGSTPQLISASGGETFANLTVNNTFGTSPQITLDDAVTVTGNLTMTSGNINLNGNAFVLGTGTGAATVGTLTYTNGWMYGGSLSRYMRPVVVAIGNAAGFFPLGGPSDSRPFWIGKTATGSGRYTVSHTDATTNTDVMIGDPAPTYIVRRHDAFWTASTTAGSGTYLLRAGGTNFGTIGANTGNTSSLRMSTTASIVGTHAAAGGTTTDPRVNRTGVSAAELANNFHIATTNLSDSPLPVVLTYFRARVEDDAVVSRWATAQEIKNHFFTVQRTTDFESFVEVGRVEGHGDSKETHAYSYIDHNPVSGKSYYRLKQTDFDGAFTYSAPVMVEYNGPSIPLLRAYPSPGSGNELTVEIRGLVTGEDAVVSMYNSHGVKVLEIKLEGESNGTYRKHLLFAPGLPAGFYYLKAGQTRALFARVIIN